MLTVMLCISVVYLGTSEVAKHIFFLWVFAPAIEDVMGPRLFLLFYLLGGLMAALAQVAVNPTSTVPSLGASGAIAAVMGAFLITYPRDRIRIAFFFLWFPRIAYVPAILLMGVWFLTQFFSEVGALAQVQTGAGVAYMAHIGGFIYGVLSGRLFESPRRRGLQKLER
jgi:membrane associated rhomboid family serine protease